MKALRAIAQQYARWACESAAQARKEFAAGRLEEAIESLEDARFWRAEARRARAFVRDVAGETCARCGRRAA